MIYPFRLSESRDNILVTQHIPDVRLKPFEIGDKIETSTSKQFPEKLIHSTTNCCELVDSAIDSLTEGQGTVIGAVDNQNLTVGNALRQELEARHLIPMNLTCFDGNKMQQPEFVQNFKVRIHLKKLFTDNIRMQRISSVLKGEAEHSIMNIDRDKWFTSRYDFEVVEKGLREPHLSLLI